MGVKGVLVILCLAFLGFSDGYRFYVGGRGGWVVKPSEEYNQWAERNRFQVNDTLLFKFKKGEDSVLVVTRDNYVHCYTKNPVQALVEPESEFKFDRSGPFYFISGNEDHCKQGQRLIVVVLAVRPRFGPPSPATPPPSPGASPGPSHAPESPEVVPSPETGGAKTPAPAPKANGVARGVGGPVGLVALWVGLVWAVVVLSS